MPPMTETHITGRCQCGGKRCELAADDPRHGQAPTYTNHGCRCDACREAWRTYPPLLAAKGRYTSGSTTTKETTT